MDWLPCYINFEPDVAIADRSGISVEPDRYLAGFPSTVIQLTRFDLTQVLGLGERRTGRVDELKVVRVQASSRCEIGRDQRTESLALDLTDLRDLISLAFSRMQSHGRGA